MKVALVPYFAKLRIIVGAKVGPGDVCTSYLPGMYSPWPEAREKGYITLEVKGNTLRAVLAAVGKSYTKAKVDYEPICPITHQLKTDFDVLVNGKNYILLPEGLDSVLKAGDRLEIDSDTLGHC